MTCTTKTVDPKTHPLLTSRLFHSRKAGTKDLFFAKEVILDHAVEVHETEAKTNFPAILGRLSAALARSLKGYFDVSYK